MQNGHNFVPFYSERKPHEAVMHAQYYALQVVVRERVFALPVEYLPSSLYQQSYISAMWIRLPTVG